MPVSEFEFAVQSASDRLTIDMARYRREVLEIVTGARGLLMSLAMQGERRLAIKHLNKVHAKVALIVKTMMDDLNYRHQVYLALELGRIGGVNVRVDRIDGETSGIRVIGKSAVQWIDKVFSRTKAKIRKGISYNAEPDRVGSIMDDLQLGVLRTLMIFMAAIDVDNKTRTTEALSMALMTATHGN